MKLEPPDQGVVYQFILAIEDSYPDYARSHTTRCASEGLAYARLHDQGDQV
jgi:hypothetical protein